MCGNCGLLFHRKNVCPNEGRVCFLCGEANHEARDCPHRTQSKCSNQSISMCSTYGWKSVIFLVDSCASSSIVGDRSALIEYTEFESPVKVKTANSDAPIYSIGEGTLPTVSC
jgi:hypothetical protein